MIPDDVRVALDALGLVPVAAEPILGLPTADDRLTLKVLLAGGGVVKARRCRWEQQARQYAALAAAATGVPLSRVLGRVGRVCLEEWIDGTPLSALPSTAARLEAAGELLGRLHRPRRVARVAPFARRLARQLARLAPSGALDPALARRVAARLLAAAPPRAAWGVIHFDLCAENLVESRDGALVAVDNERLAPGFLDFDLARTWYRWRMTPGEWGWFSAAYARHRAVPLGTVRFWRLAAAATSLSLRIRGGAGRLAAPLEVIAELLGD